MPRHSGSPQFSVLLRSAGTEPLTPKADAAANKHLSSRLQTALTVTMAAAVAESQRLQHGANISML